MPQYWIELSGENLDLAAAEASGAAESVGGRIVSEPTTSPHVRFAELPSDDSARSVAERLALARRVVRTWSDQHPKAILRRFGDRGHERQGASFRAVGQSGGFQDGEFPGDCVRAFRDAGGTVDLENPTHRFWFLSLDRKTLVGEEVAAVDRRKFADRRMPKLPFRRPVSLPPRLGRVVVNLARIRSGDSVVDPFLGTGALALEAALLGARVTGVDRDLSMVRGAVQNFSAIGVGPERLVADDAESVAHQFDDRAFHALVTDPPYGRASSSGHELPAALMARVLSAWAPKVRLRGRIVVVVAGGPDPLPPEWTRVLLVRDRVHRSLTREFRVYERRG